MNHLYYGDNLGVLRAHVPSASVDLIYLDPPFNSNAGYNPLFKAPDGSGSAAQIEAFNDTWHWTDAAEEAFQDVRRSGNAAVADMLGAMRGFLGENDMMAYLAMMTVRLIEFRRRRKIQGKCLQREHFVSSAQIDRNFHEIGWLNRARQRHQIIPP